MPEKLPDEIVQSIAISNAKLIEEQPAEPGLTQEIAFQNTLSETINDLKATTASLKPGDISTPGES
jgi:hypothetical protein